MIARVMLNIQQRREPRELTHTKHPMEVEEEEEEEEANVIYLEQSHEQGFWIIPGRRKRSRILQLQATSDSP